MRDVALGVEQLTHAGVIWIDGKPENVLVDRKPGGSFTVKVSGEGGQQGGGVKLQRGGQGRLMMASREQQGGEGEAAEKRTGEAHYGAKGAKVRMGYAAMNSTP